MRPLAYVDDWRASAGETIGVKASGEGDCRIDLVRLAGLIGHPLSTGYVAEPIGLSGHVSLIPQMINAGSFAVADTGPSIDASDQWQWDLDLFPTLTDGGTVLELGALTIELCGGALVAKLGDARLSVPIPERAWSELRVAHDGGKLSLSLTPAGVDARWRQHRQAACATRNLPLTGPLTLARQLNGKVGAPRLMVNGSVAAGWDFSANMACQSVPGTGPQARPLRLINAPGRAVTSKAWDGLHHDWTLRPNHYDAIHFHDDDLSDCAWKDSFQVKIPEDASGGIYAVRITGDHGVHHVPLFVKRPRCHEVAFLASTFSYLAYANSLWASPSAAAIAAAYPNETEAMRQCGLSTYSRHRDGSGVGLVSMRRPMLNLAPGFLGEAIGGQALINDDLRILSWLDRIGQGYGVVTDHDLHESGAAALADYRVLVTGSHPEYHSRESLDAIAAFVDGGGRMMYMGGNGFYWRVSLLPDAPHVMELRRAEGGIRMWAEEPGQYYHQADGELGGLWRRLGRAPNRLVGVGFSAQADEQPSVPYRPTAAAKDDRAAFMFDGVKDGAIGEDNGLCAAGGYELDRADIALGTPPHALVVARTDPIKYGFEPVNEERLTHTVLDCDDPIRADMTFFETGAGGAVFSTGSILFAGRLDEEDGAGRIAANVMRRFADPSPFAMPDAD